MFKDYVEKEKESIPIALREISSDYAEKFTLIRCLAVLSDKVFNIELPHRDHLLIILCSGLR